MMNHTDVDIILVGWLNFSEGVDGRMSICEVLDRCECYFDSEGLLFED